MHVWGRVWDSVDDGSQAMLEPQAVQWLKAHSLEKYKDQLAQQGVRKMQDIQDVNEEILSSCGFTPFDKVKFIARRSERPNRERSDLISWVRRNNLEHCMEAMLLQGIETLQDLCEAGESIQTMCGLEEPEIKQLRQILEGRLCRSSSGTRGSCSQAIRGAKSSELVFDKADGTWKPAVTSPPDDKPLLKTNLNILQSKPSLDIPSENGKCFAYRGSLGANEPGRGRRGTDEMVWCPSTKTWKYTDPIRTASALPGLASVMETDGASMDRSWRSVDSGGRELVRNGGTGVGVPARRGTTSPIRKTGVEEEGELATLVEKTLGTGRGSAHQIQSVKDISGRGSTDNMKQTQRLEGHTDWVRACRFSPSDQTMVTVSRDKTARVWDTRSWNCLAVLKAHTDWVRDCIFSPNGVWLVTVSHDCTARAWTTRSSPQSSPWRCDAALSGHNEVVRSAAFSPNSLFLVTVCNDTAPRVWDAGLDSPARWTCVARLAGHSGLVMVCRFSPDGASLVTASFDSTLRVWDGASWARLQTLAGHTGSVMDCQFSPAGEVLVSTSNDATIRIWDTDCWTCITTLTGHTNTVRRCRFSPNGLWLVTVSNDETVRVWETDSWKHVTTLLGHNEAVLRAVFSADSTHLFTLEQHDKGVYMWATGTWKLKRKLSGHSGAVCDFTMAPSGKALVTVSTDQNAIVWSDKTNPGWFASLAASKIRSLRVTA